MTKSIFYDVIPTIISEGHFRARDDSHVTGTADQPWVQGKKALSTSVNAGVIAEEAPNCTN
jgi:hypothetical protein